MSINSMEFPIAKIDNADLRDAKAGAQANLFACAYDHPSMQQKSHGQSKADKPADSEQKQVKNEAHDVASEKFSDKCTHEFQQLLNKLSHAKGATPATIFEGLQKRGKEINAELEKEGKSERINLAAVQDGNTHSVSYFFLVNAKNLDAGKTADAILNGTKIPSVVKVGTYSAPPPPATDNSKLS